MARRNPRRGHVGRAESLPPPLTNSDMSRVRRAIRRAEGSLPIRLPRRALGLKPGAPDGRDHLPPRMGEPSDLR